VGTHTLLTKRVKDEMVRVLQKEYLRRSLVEYFVTKGYDKTFDKCPYPLVLQDIQEEPFAKRAIEVVYGIEDIDLIDNSIKVSWNMFILGNKRIFLGYTNHKNFSDIKNNKANIKDFNGPITISNIIDTIVEFIGSSTAIYDLNKKTSDGNLKIRPLFSKY